MNPVIQKMIENNKILQKQRRYYQRTKYRAPQSSSQKLYYQSIYTEQEKITSHVLPNITIQHKVQFIKKQKKQQGFFKKFKKQQITKQNLILLNKIQNIFKRSLPKTNNKFNKSNEGKSNSKSKNRGSIKSISLKNINKIKSNHQNGYSTFSQNNQKRINSFEIDKKKSQISLIAKNTQYNQQLKFRKENKNCEEKVKYKSRCQTQQISFLPKISSQRKRSLNVKIDKEYYENSKHNISQDDEKLLLSGQSQKQEQIIDCNQKLKSQNCFSNKFLEQKLQSENYKSGYQQNFFLLKRQSQIQANRIILASRIYQISGINFKIDFIRGYQYYQICATPQEEEKQKKLKKLQEKMKTKLFQVKQIEQSVIKPNYIHYKMYSPQQNKIITCLNSQDKKKNESNDLKLRKILTQEGLKIFFSESQGKYFFQKFDYNYEEILQRLSITKNGTLVLIAQKNQKSNHKKSNSFTFSQRDQQKSLKLKTSCLSFRYDSQQNQ